MLDINRIEQSSKPDKIVYLGNNIYYYNYDIKEFELEVLNPESLEPTLEKRWSFILLRILGKPNYNKCVKALIRAYVDTNEELDLINSYNAYLLDVTTSNVEYEEYLLLLKTIKANVRKDFGEQEPASKDSSPKQKDIIKLMSMAINTIKLTDQLSLSVKSLYPNWEDMIGQLVQKDDKLLYKEKLFKVVQTHTVQSHFPPSIGTYTLYVEIVEDHAGTLEDPIPYPADGNIVIYKGKYYSSEGVIYRCIRDSGLPLYEKLAFVVGNYVEKVKVV